MQIDLDKKGSCFALDFSNKTENVMRFVIYLTESYLGPSWSETYQN